MAGPLIRFGLAAAVLAVVVLIGVDLLRGSDIAVRPRSAPTLVSPSASPGTTVPPDVSDRGAVGRGLLEPGTYTYADVDGQGFNVRFTVPADWTWNGRYLGTEGVGPPAGAAIYFFGGPVHVYADPRHWAGAQATPPVSFSAAELVAALAAQPMRHATTPIRRSADSPWVADFWPGMEVKLTVPAHLDLAECDRGQFRSWGPGDRVRSAQGPGQRDLVWAVDVDGASVTGAGAASPPGGLIIDAASFPRTPKRVMSQIDAILGSIVVGSWG